MKAAVYLRSRNFFQKVACLASTFPVYLSNTSIRSQTTQNTESQNPRSVASFNPLLNHKSPSVTVNRRLRGIRLKKRSSRHRARESVCRKGFVQTGLWEVITGVWVPSGNSDLTRFSSLLTPWCWAMASGITTVVSGWPPSAVQNNLCRHSGIESLCQPPVLKIT